MLVSEIDYLLRLGRCLKSCNPDHDTLTYVCKKLYEYILGSNYEKYRYSEWGLNSVRYDDIFNESTVNLIDVILDPYNARLNTDNRLILKLLNKKELSDLFNRCINKDDDISNRVDAFYFSLYIIYRRLFNIEEV